MRRYDRSGVPITSEHAAELRRDKSYVVVARSKLMDGADGKVRDVSTVWLGVDHAFGSDGPPVIFETLVLDADGEEIECRRYCTELEARTGHAELVTLTALAMDVPIVLEVL